MKNKQNNKGKRRLMCLLVAGIALIIIAVTTLFSLFGSLFRYELQSLMWPLAIAFLVVDLLFWIIPTLDVLPEERRKLIKIYRIIFSLIGGVLFIIDAFIYIENKIYSLMVVIIVLCYFIGLICLKKLFKDCFNNKD